MRVFSRCDFTSGLQCHSPKHLADQLSRIHQFPSGFLILWLWAVFKTPNNETFWFQISFSQKDIFQLNVGAHNIINYTSNTNSLGVIMFKRHETLQYKLCIFLYFRLFLRLKDNSNVEIKTCIRFCPPSHPSSNKRKDTKHCLNPSLRSSSK